MRHISSILRVLGRSAIFFSIAVAATASAADPVAPGQAKRKLPSVPDGFTIEVAAESPLVQHPMMAGFDARGRLFIGASAGVNLRAHDLMKEPPSFVRMLEDTNGDGRFDKSTIFADKMTLPMGALWHRGALYVASPPSIWRLEDTDGDGVADKRDEIVNTFGFSGNAASVHGCFLGPNGRIYWCDGRHGHEFKDEQGRIISSGAAARIFSCRTDGSDVQVFAGGGMDNPVEVDFLPTGEMLGSVNILYGRPRADCLVHWIDGGVYPRRDQQACIAEFDRTGDILPPMTNFGHVAVSGMNVYRSTQFGLEYANNVFTTSFNGHKVIRSVLERTGATFRTREEDFFVSDDPDCHPTDVLEDADGSLLVIDTGGWFRIGCPVSQVAKPDVHGTIYRIRRKGATPVIDPRGLTLKLHQRSPQELTSYLGDLRPAVRDRVVDLLALQGESAIAALTAVRRADPKRSTGTARRNAVWALSRIDSKSARSAIRDALTDNSEGVRIAAARSLGTLRDVDSIVDLAKLLRTDSPSVRRQAATAIGRIGNVPRVIISQQRQPTSVTLAVAVEDSQKTVAGGKTNFDRPDRTSKLPIVPVKADAAKPIDTASRTTVGVKVLINSEQAGKSLKAIFDGLPSASADRYLEHALIMAAIRLSDRDQTVPYLKHANPQVRRAALIVLDQIDGGNLTRELVIPLLDTDDPQLQQEALAIIARHDGWAAETLTLLRSWLADAKLSPERTAVLRGFLLSQVQQQEIQTLIAESLARPQLSAAVRTLLLEVIYRAALTSLPEPWVVQLGRALDHSEPAVRLQSIQTLQERQINQFDGQLQKLAERKTESAEIRIESLAALLPRSKSLDKSSFAFLISHTNNDAPPLLRLAASRAISDAPLDDAQLLQLAEQLKTAGPLAVPVLLQAFAKSKAQSIGTALVAALTESPGSSSISPDELAGLLRKYPPAVQQAGSVLLKKLGVDSKQQAAQLKKLAHLTKDGDAKKGREIFFGKKAACASCHAVAAKGGRAGPDLTKIGGIRTGRDLLEAVALPSATFARGFRPYIIVTEQGRIFTGIISRQTTDTIYLRTAQLAEIRIPRDQIDEMKESSTSIMPKGLEKTLTPEEFRDLLAYLQQRK